MMQRLKSGVGTTGCFLQAVGILRRASSCFLEYLVAYRVMTVH